jgi:hypothetical protein
MGKKEWDVYFHIAFLGKTGDRTSVVSFFTGVTSTACAFFCIKSGIEFHYVGGNGMNYVYALF